MLKIETREPKFPIGIKYKTSGKNPRIATVIDILRTYNNAGELVKFRYVAQYPSALNIITDYDVCEATIAIRQIK